MAGIYVCVPTLSGSTGQRFEVKFSPTLEAATACCAYMSDYGVSAHPLPLGPPIFGQDYQSVSSDAESGTTSSTYQDKVSLTTPALTGTYLVTWQARVENSSPNKITTAHLENTTDTTTVSGDHEQSAGAGMASVKSGFGEVVFTGAAKTFKIQWKTSGGTATISQARITIWRVA